MQPRDLIATARLLAKEDRQGRPRQALLKRAISTAYYSMFHALCRNCADTVVGTSGANRSEQAWQQAYRSVEHNFSKKQCVRDDINKFPGGIQEFAEKFGDLQRLRYLADYDPHHNISRSTVQIAIDTAEMAINQLENADSKHRTAFAVWTVMKKRP